ncbi:glycyl-radical enzyme activating protein [Synergistales bacterium]|nr:glycyl-radical enzyme activating protein [Synergistales bacterium]
MDKAELKATIFDIEPYRNEDGPGMRTMVFFKGCPLRCLWCSNPFGLSRDPQLIVNVNKCAGCRKCAEVCEASVNCFKEDGLHVDFKNCALCGKCTLVCIPDARRISGREYTVSEVFEEVQKNELFHRRNSGGITLSGGEVLYQSEFASELLRLCKTHFIHTTIETSGFAKWEAYESVAKYCDLVFNDLKIFDTDRHKKYTGVGNQQILQNIQNLCAFAEKHRKPKVIIRRLVIDGVTTDEDVIAGAKFINDLPTHPEINLLPFHNFGETKYAMAGKEYPFEDKKLLLARDSLMQHVRDLVVEYAPNCVVSLGGGNINA